MSPTNREKLTARAGTTSVEFRLPPPPKLRDHVAGKQYLEGVRSFDEAMTQWHQEAQRVLNEHFSQISSKIPTGSG
jgi:hypothetical protein